MNGCKGCFHAVNESKNPDVPECFVCIRSPEYPTQKMPEEVLINGLTLRVPQDMYIAKDRKEYEERMLRKEISKIMETTRPQPKKDSSPQDWQPWTPYPSPSQPWEDLITGKRNWWIKYKTTATDLEDESTQTNETTG